MNVYDFPCRLTYASPHRLRGKWIRQALLSDDKTALLLTFGDRTFLCFRADSEGEITFLWKEGLLQRFTAGQLAWAGFCSVSEMARHMDDYKQFIAEHRKLERLAIYKKLKQEFEGTDYADLPVEGSPVLRRGAYRNGHRPAEGC